MPRGGPTTRSSRPTYDLTARDQGAWGEQEVPSRLCTGLRRTALGALLWSRGASAVRYNSEEEIRARITRLPRRHARRRRPSSGPTRKSQKSTPDARLGARSNHAFSLDFDIVMQQIRRRLDVRRLQRVKLRRTQFEQMSSGLPLKADISRFMSTRPKSKQYRHLVQK